MKLLILVLLTVVVVWLWGDFIYSRMVASHLRKWDDGNNKCATTHSETS